MKQSAQYVHVVMLCTESLLTKADAIEMICDNIKIAAT